ncbi:hypothetical protein EJI01_21645 [Variovorax sp. MHTC-1]|nr:hypothetical protein EJI01_21645 [Variovorax sp. MHTC-1]
MPWPSSGPGHTKLESTVRYLRIEVDDALEISEQTARAGRQGAAMRSGFREPPLSRELQARHADT